MVFMGIFPLLVIGLAVWAIMEVSRRRDDHPAPVQSQPPTASPGPLATQTSAVSTAPSARALLDERYAKGEIGREEYLQCRGDLG
jgi:hypothetical protein